MATAQQLLRPVSSSLASSSHACVRAEVDYRSRHCLKNNAAPNLKTSHLSVSTLPKNYNIVELMKMDCVIKTQEPVFPLPPLPNPSIIKEEEEEEQQQQQRVLVAKLYAVAEAAADRAEMHGNIKEQRNNWNTLLLNSINAITLTAATMVAIEGLMTQFPGYTSLSLRVSSTLLYSGATALLLVMNKIQPSQLAEEQRNADRLFRNLHAQIQTHLSQPNHHTTPAYVNKMMKSLLALDKAYPLPLLPGMLEKFPANVEPTVWWPHFNSHSQVSNQQQLEQKNKTKKNGWSKELENGMAKIVGVLKEKDTADYLRLSKLVLNINKFLATAGPLLTGAAAVGAAFSGGSSVGGVVGVVGGVLACMVNVFEHGGQVGMVFEMYRNCAGSYRLLEETIESTLREDDPDRRENGELFEMKMALQLGRSLSSLRRLAAAGDRDEFAGKLF